MAPVPTVTPVELSKALISMYRFAGRRSVSVLIERLSKKIIQISSWEGESLTPRTKHKRRTCTGLLLCITEYLDDALEREPLRDVLAGAEAASELSARELHRLEATPLRLVGRDVAVVLSAHKVERGHRLHAELGAMLCRKIPRGSHNGGKVSFLQRACSSGRACGTRTAHRRRHRSPRRRSSSWSPPCRGQ